MDKAFETNDEKSPRPALGARPEGGEMDDDELRATLHSVIEEAKTFVDSELGPVRTKANDYFLGRPFGGEKENRSQVVLTDVRDTVKAIIADLLRMFFGPEQQVEYAPTRADTIEQAEQATDFVNAVVLQQDNPGFLTFHSWFMDALVRRLGVVKVWWDAREEVTETELENVTLQAYEKLVQDREVKVLSIDLADPDSVAGPIYRCKIRRTRKDGRIRIEAVPPEEFLYNRDARSLDEALMVGHRTMKRRGELVAMGVSEKLLDEHGSGSSDLVTNTEALSRSPNSRISGEDETDAATALIEYVEAYVRMDFDGDGIEDIYLVKCIGNGHYPVEPPLKVNRRPFALLCPAPEPHTITGLSVADDTMDLQRITSFMTRSMLDSLSLSVSPRQKVVEGRVNMADVLNTDLGAPIRMDSLDALDNIVTPFPGKEVLPVLQYMESVKARRTGIREGAARLNPDALQSTTATAVAMMDGASQAQVELIARIFAETGVKTLYRLVLRLLCENQPRARVARLRGTFVEIDPRSWDAEMDVVVNVALGSGLTEKKIATLMEAANEQKAILAMLGPSNPTVSLAQYIGTIHKVMKLRGIKNPEAYFTIPDPNWQPPQQEQKPDPQMMLVQVQAQAAQAKAQIEQQKLQLAAESQEEELRLNYARVQREAAQHASQEMEAQARLELDRQKMMMEDERAREQSAQQVYLQEKELELKYSAQAQTELIKQEAENAREQARMEHELIAAGIEPPASKATKDGETPPPPRNRVITVHRGEDGKIAGATVEEKEAGAEDFE